MIPRPSLHSKTESLTTQRPAHNRLYKGKNGELKGEWMATEILRRGKIVAFSLAKTIGKHAKKDINYSFYAPYDQYSFATADSKKNSVKHDCMKEKAYLCRQIVSKFKPQIASK